MEFKVIATSSGNANDILEKYPRIRRFVYYINQVAKWGGGSFDELSVEIPTIEELIEFQEAVEREIIIDKETIEIYDDYRE